MPEYNHSFSAALKNALDHLFIEWSDQPVAFVSYGGLSGGRRLVAHSRSHARGRVPNRPGARA
jgi:NAD(P)H-dependent FMN reductase